MANIRIRTSRLQKGMVIKSDVYTKSGVIIVPEDTVVTKEVFDLLTRHFIDDVIVEYTPEQSKNPDPQLLNGAKGINLQQFNEFKHSFHVAEEQLSQSLKDIAYSDKDVDVPMLLDMIHSVVEKTDNDTNLCDMLFHMRDSSEDLYSHSINVSLFAQMLARWAGLSTEEVELVSVAGLLHDLGHLKYETTDFTFHDELDKKVHPKHPSYGYKLIQQKELDYRIKQAILTHHERMDESGFPMGVSFANINTTARVIAIADTYATLTMNEPGHTALSPFEALKTLQDLSFSKFDSRLFMTFLERIAQSFIQHEVLLNDGRKGVIIMLNKLDLTRPLVQIEDTFVDLAIKKDLAIKRILK